MANTQQDSHHIDYVEALTKTNVHVVKMEEEMKKFGINLERSENEILIKKQKLQNAHKLFSVHPY